MVALLDSGTDPLIITVRQVVAVVIVQFVVVFVASRWVDRIGALLVAWLIGLAGTGVIWLTHLRGGAEVDSGLERLADVEKANLALWAEVTPDNDTRLEPTCVALAQIAGETFSPPPDPAIGAKWTETMQSLHKGAQACADAIHGVVKDDGTMARELIKGRDQLAELITALK